MLRIFRESKGNFLCSFDGTVLVDGTVFNNLQKFQSKHASPPAKRKPLPWVQLKTPRSLPPHPRPPLAPPSGLGGGGGCVTSLPISSRSARPFGEVISPAVSR